MLSRCTAVALLLTCMLMLSGCRPLKQEQPRLAPGTRFEDIRFHSNALGHDAVYRVIVPTPLPPGTLPVVWLIHGSGGDFTLWSTHSDISTLAAHGVLLVMPDAENSLLVNTSSGSRYEDYVLNDLTQDLRQHFPQAALDARHNAIAGISRGGFSAINLALRHPERFGYAAGLSPALDFAERPFRWQQVALSLQLRATLGASGSEHRKQNDPFFLVRHMSPLPYIYLACADRDVLTPSTRYFNKLLTEQGASHTFREAPGGHDWTFWRQQIPPLEANLASWLAFPEEQSAARR